MRATNLILIVCFALLSCKKGETLPDKEIPAPSADLFTKYTIQQGQHYCNLSAYKPVETSEMKFMVRFDSSSVYQTEDPVNQYDINKLFGFSDNNMDHHQYSARFGWRWSEGALRLFGYVYNNGVVSSQEISTVAIGAQLHCSIRISPTHYIFSVNEITDSLVRTSTTPRAKGYQLFPYFGGDEAAPHQVDIWIKEEE
jgi:hypothetical protein